MNLRVLMAPDQIDKKFTQRGWRLDPALCPGCAAPKPKDPLMGASPSPAAIRGQTETLKLLAQHFDGENGRYVTGWSDATIAKAAGISTETVAAFRIAGFGEIKEPAEVALLRSDINSLEALQRDHASAMSTEIAALRGRLVDLSKVAA
ncbi:hypothetical protein [Sphingomonas montanisoli]|uniref:Uncharacterized protein n=1 Tax=Sphingomonas montanisoli TaxID=2606412 RepID=A0A5D9C121_9SPHN|nr:hypothetical protein [Sphingomonas montanisoli]TZG24887.1 hypothetical protein FYJ91_16530 [Sphingomonas montanisoli]